MANNNVISKLLCLSLAFFACSCGLYKMAKGEVKVIKETEIQQYKLVLLKKHGWVGPPNFYYCLQRKNIFGTFKTKYSIDVRMLDTLKCSFILKGKRGKSVTVDKCKKTARITKG